MSDTEADRNETGSALQQCARRRTGNNGRAPKMLYAHPSVAAQKTIKASKMNRAGDVDRQAVRETLRLMLAEPPHLKVKPLNKVEVVCRNLVEAAMSGNQYAMQKIIDIVDDMPSRDPQAGGAAKSTGDPYLDMLAERERRPSMESAVAEINQSLDDVRRRWQSGDESNLPPAQHP